MNSNTTTQRIINEYKRPFEAKQIENNIKLLVEATRRRRQRKQRKAVITPIGVWMSSSNNNNKTQRN